VRTLLQLAAVLALVTLSVGAAVITFDVHYFILDLDVGVRRADNYMADAKGEWQNEKASVHSILSGVQDATQQAQLFAREQRAQLDKTSHDSDTQVKALSLVTRNAETLLYNLDQQLNGKILPDFDRELVSTSTAAQFSFESLTKAGDALTFQINDPAIARTVQSLDTAAANGADILGHFDHVAGYYDKKLTTPLGFWKTMLKEMVPVAGAAGSVAAGFAR
jgi:hypothetical protein